jgi:hypothetical protein
MAPTATATSFLLSARRATRWSTGAESLDALLTPIAASVSGFAVGQMVEISGAPGEGKTRMCIALAVRCRLPSSCDVEGQGENDPEGQREVLVVGQCSPAIKLSLFLLCHFSSFYYYFFDPEIYG